MYHKQLQTQDPEVFDYLQGEQTRQREGMEFIASENYQSPAVLAIQSSVFANKYSEGTPGRRYYGGQEYTDKIESLAIQRAKELFHADHANVQALSGAAANLCAYHAMMKPGSHILGMDLSHGGHLTHGHPTTLSAQIYQFHRYTTTANGLIDYDKLAQTAKAVRPDVLLAGFSAYPRTLDYARFAQIAQDVGAYAYADMAHIGGFIAAGILENPLDHGFHAMMTTTHKSLRGPRGALLLSKGKVGNPLKAPEPTKENLPTLIDRAVFPGVQGGPHMHTIAAIAVALKEAESDQFHDYARQSLYNAQVMATEFLNLGYALVTGGTDNHMIILDFQATDHIHFDGAYAEQILDTIGISTNKSMIPHDPNPAFRPSGLRIGTPAMTTRGMKGDDIQHIVQLMHQAFVHHDDKDKLLQLKEQVQTLAQQFPVPSL